MQLWIVRFHGGFTSRRLAAEQHGARSMTARTKQTLVRWLQQDLAVLLFTQET